MGLLQKVFGGKNSQFQNQVLEILKKEHPELSFQAGNLSTQIKLGSAEFELTRLQETCQKNQTQAEEFIRLHFSHVVALATPAEDISWQQANSRIRPQLIPIEFAQHFSAQLFPFTEEMGIGIVTKRASLIIFSQERI
jgi:hypothetical protein